MTKIRYAQVGIGGRSQLFSRAIVEEFADTSELVALCDNNVGRLRLRVGWAGERDVEVKTYQDDEFDRMIAETRPDVVIVTTQDSLHDKYICRAMELGCDVMTEKPMTTDEQKCQRIIDTQHKTGRQCTVTFNYRYAPPRTQIKDLLMSGVIGNVVSVDFHWLLDTRHGADYFRRWHRHKRNSGGLMVHKATHHFDLVNWWLSTVPETVYATGTRNFYRPETADRYGLTQRGQRCLDCPAAAKCSFHLDLREYPELRRMYLETEQHDGYFRDRCVFGADIDIEDTVDVVVNYRNGAMMSYSLHSFMPWEGYIVTFNGVKGRLEHICQESVYFSGDGSVPGELMPEGTKIKIFLHSQSAYGVEIWQSEGGHGGADPIMVKDLFAPASVEDKYKRAADYRSGAWSILTGVAANRSMASGKPVRIDDLIHNLPDPDYPPMPAPTDPLEIVSQKSAAPEWFKKEVRDEK
ncbi:MAG: Gfo/Idh/MocA family oxidoreductase [Anaerolineae bacterium]|nr:Gfo/Idh/MocA family oxidoreductase [Anaerolineae bacterium]